MRRSIFLRVAVDSSSNFDLLRSVHERTDISHLFQDLDQSTGPRPLALLAISAHKSVANSRDRKNQIGFLGILFKLLPQTRNVSVDCSGEGICIITPDSPEKFVSRHRCTRPLHQIAQKLEFARSEIDRLPLACHLTFPYIHANGAKLMDALTGMDRNAAQ